MSVVWNDIFQYKLGVDPSQHGLVLTESLNSSPFAAAATVSSMFDTFQVPYVGLVPAAAMALYASGRETGVTLDVGGGLLQVLPIINGDPVMRTDGAGAAKHTAHLGGKDLTQRFARMLMPHRGAWLPSIAEYSVMENLKDKACRMAASPMEYDELERNPVETFTEYTMPDGLELSVGHECIKAPECLFRAELGLTTSTVQQHFAEALAHVDPAEMPELLNNVVLSGGTTLTTGFQERVLWELNNTMGAGSVRVIAKPERKYLSWIGASIVSTLATFKDSWLTAGEYMEVGESLVHRKGMFTSLRASEDDILADPFYAPPFVKPPTKLEAIAPPVARIAGAANMSLWRAAIEGDVGATVIAIEMSDPVTLNSQDPHNQGFTAMHFAARYGNADVIDTLIKAGASTCTKDDFGKTALHWAAEYDRDSCGAEAAGLLVAANAEVNGKDNQGRTALQYAARAGQQAVVDLLLAAGADAESMDKTFRNARDWASKSVTDSKALPPPPNSEDADSWYYNNLGDSTQ